MTARPDVYLNCIETAVPAHDVHEKFVSYAPQLIRDDRMRRVFSRLASKTQIQHRFSVIEPASESDRLAADGFYERGEFPSTGERMKRYQSEALRLAEEPVARILQRVSAQEITHLIVTSCTGFYAPGLDLELQKRFDLRADLERSVIGFMGCYAAFNALKSAWHIVRSQPDAKVLVVSLELCTLHLQENDDMEQLLAFLQFADGCAACVVSAEPFGLRLDRFKNQVLSSEEGLIQWKIGDRGFDMHLSTDVPQALSRALPPLAPLLLTPEERAAVTLWAVHPGGRAILDAVQDKLGLSENEMSHSRGVLKNFGNMSSATILFVFKEILNEVSAFGAGLGMAFGPGLTIESVVFNKARM